MRWQSKNRFGVAKVGTVLTATVLIATASAPRAEAPSLAAKLWTVSRIQADGMTRCEIAMSGRNADAGGFYVVHLISDDAHPTTIIIEHDGDDIAARNAAFLMNGSFKLITLDILQQNYDRQRRGVYMQMGRSAYVDQFLNQLGFPESHFMNIKIGRRSFATVVEGFKAITDKLHECEQSINTSENQSSNPSQPR